MVESESGRGDDHIDIHPLPFDLNAIGSDRLRWGCYDLDPID